MSLNYFLPFGAATQVLKVGFYIRYFMKFPLLFSPIGGYRYNSGLDQLKNVCFDRNINLTVSRFDALRQNSPYYQWLLDIDGFDFSSFELV